MIYVKLSNIQGLTQTTKIYFNHELKSTRLHTNKLKEKKDFIIGKLKEIPRENIYTIPNLITVGRMIITPFLSYFIITHQYKISFFLLIVSGIDGYIARKYNMKSIIGTVLDPMADKILITVLTISSAYVNLIPINLAYLIIGRDALLFTAAFYYRYISLPPPKTFTRYWDFSIPSVEIKPKMISKVNTLVQLSLLGFSLFLPAFSLNIPYFLESFQYFNELKLRVICMFTTISSGLSYLFSNNVMNIISKKSKLK